MQVCLFLKTGSDADYTAPLSLWRDHRIKDSTSAIFSNRGIECWPIAREGFSGSHQGDVDGCMATLDDDDDDDDVFFLMFSSCIFIKI